MFLIQLYILLSCFLREYLLLPQGPYEVRAMSLDATQIPCVECKAELFAEMEELRYLSIKSCHVHGDFSKWPKELRWLQWWGYHCTELPHTLDLQSLAVLDLGGNHKLSCILDKHIETKVRMIVFQTMEY